jgi:hypothetical protein
MRAFHWEREGGEQVFERRATRGFDEVTPRLTTANAGSANWQRVLTAVCKRCGKEPGRV